MKIHALVGAAALAALAISGAAFAQDAAPSGPGTMAPIPNPSEAPKAMHHHHGKHVKMHAKAHAKAHMKTHAKTHHKGHMSAKGKAAPPK